MSTKEVVHGCEVKAVQPLLFRMDSLHHQVKDLRDKVTATVDRVAGIAQTMAATAMRALGARGPDPDAAYPPSQRETDRILEGLLTEIVELRRRPTNFGGVGGSASRSQFIIGILITLNIAITGAVSTWVVNSITRQGEVQNDQGKDIAVIKCRIDPQCRVVVSNDKP